LPEIARELFRQGNSIAIVIPRPILLMMIGDDVDDIKQYEGVFAIESSGKVRFFIRRKGDSG
jgi:antitoxin component of MazEF toxin-antitoxin module